MANVPPIIIQHPEDGVFTIGRERRDDTRRIKDIGLHGSSSAGMRIFHDGGFELRSSDDDTAIQGSQIVQKCDKAPLIIKSAGDILIECDGRFSVVANDIRMSAKNADEGDITLKAKHDINIDADNRIIAQSENVILNAKDKVLSFSKGWNVMVGNVIRIHEPTSQLVPPKLGDYLKSQTKTLEN
tara:strand:+ start:2010 stop:2564 length:555 start_codon:yes stop_codon:yes gene_type:complete